MKHSFYLILIVSIAILFMASGCNLPFSIQVVPQNQATEVPATEAAPSQTPIIITQTPLPTEAPTNTAEAVATEEPTATLEPTAIVHSSVPGDSSYLSDQVASDCDTGIRSAGQAQVVISGCDYWNREWLERPADSATGTYNPALDILWSQAGKVEPWVFLRIKFHELGTLPEGYKAGFEIDTDLDSRGEFLLLVKDPTATTWTTDGVQVWQDKNGDVGGQKPFVFDQNNGDGYETLLFDSGVGQDPDLAWARISPKDPNIIEFAFKTALLPNPKLFGWWAWAGATILDPAKFEPVDRLADTDTWNLDNTCSWIWGTTPTPGQLANLCLIVQPTPTPTAVPTTVTGGCPAGPHFCRIGTYWDEATCSCKRMIIIIPTKTPIIIY